MGKRLLSLVLVLCIMPILSSSFMLVDSLSLDQYGNGSKETPYRISTAEQLNNIRNDLEAYYELISDIDLSNWGDWEPIGPSSNQSFDGSLEGNGHTIAGLHIGDASIQSGESWQYLGLFGYCGDTSLISNIYFENVLIQADQGKESSISNSYIGTVAGRCNGSIQGCIISGDINIINCYNASVGGVAGFCNSIYNSINSANINLSSCEPGIHYPESSSFYCGGIVGYGHNIKASINTGIINITGNAYTDCGGIVGRIVSALENCINYGDIFAMLRRLDGWRGNGEPNGSIGGICGVSSYNKSYISHCANYGSIESKGYTTSRTNQGGMCAGGMVGYSGIWGSGVVVISNCYNASSSISAKTFVYKWSWDDDHSDEVSSLAHRIIGRGGFSDSDNNNFSLGDSFVNGVTPVDDIGDSKINGATITQDKFDEAIVAILQNIPSFSLDINNHNTETTNHQDNGFIITFISNGGTGSMASATFNDVTTIVLPSCGFTPPSGKQFKAWNIGGVEYQPGTSYKFTENTTVTAIWQNRFNEYIFRGNFLTGKEAPAETIRTYMDLTTPAELFVQTAEESGLADQLAAWDTIIGAFDAVNDPTSLAKTVIKPKDMYTAIIMNMLEASVSYDALDKRVEKVLSGTDRFVSNLNGLLRTEFQLDMEFDDAYKNLNISEKEKLRLLLQDYSKTWLKDEQPDLVELGDTLEAFTNGIDVANGVKNYLERITSCAIVASMNEYIKDVIREAYQVSLQSEDIYIQLALKDCQQIVNSSAEQLVQKLATEEIVVLGAKSAQYYIKELFWKDVKANLFAQIPGAALIMATYSASKFATNLMFGTDSINERYLNLVVVTDIKNLMRLTSEKLRSEFVKEQTEYAAHVYLSSIDLVFQAMDKSCEQAYKYVDVIDNIMLSKILTFFGKQDHSGVKTSIQELQSLYRETYNFNTRAWVYYLDQYYPDSGLSEYYMDLYIDPNTHTFKKEIIAACPVDVYVYNQSGNVVASVIGNDVICDDDSIMIARNGDTKIVRFLEDNLYRVEYVGTSAGDMDVTISEFGENEEIVRTTNYYDVGLKIGTAYDVIIDGSILNPTTYVMKNTSDNFIVKQDYDSLLTNGSSHSVSVQSGILFQNNGDIFVTSTARVGELLELQAVVPENAQFICWETTNSNVVFSDRTAQTATFVMPDSDVVISAIYSGGTVSAIFSDANQIKYSEAVKTLIDLGVIIGYEDNTFRPNGTLTRAEACTILTRLTAAGNVSSSAPFTDTIGHWGESYIAYCASKGIVIGYGDGTFGPNDILTGSQWAKMLLCALGYNADYEGMSDSTWEFVVLKLVRETGLSNDITDFDLSAYISRDEACQLGLNTLYANTVEYDSILSWVIGGEQSSVVTRIVGSAQPSISFAEKYWPDSNLV